MKPKILIVGSDKVYAIENFYVRHLREAGADVALFTAQNYFYDFYNRSPVHKVLHKLSLSGIMTKINRLYRAEVERFRPDAVWVFKGMEINPESVVWTKQRGIPIVNYNPDNPFIFSGPGSGNKNVTDSIGLYDLHFTYNLSVKEKLETDFGAKVHFLPFGFELNPGLYDSLRTREERVGACFAGNPDETRAPFILAVAEAGIAIDVFGTDWPRFTRHKNIRCHPPVYADGFWDILHRYRVQLNLMRVHNLDSHNMRTFEVPAAGGIMLAPATREHAMFFEDRKEAFFFSGETEGIALMKEILAMNASASDEVRLRARRRSLESGYSYQDRAQEAFRVIKNL